jgi:hypothetical protein
MLNKTNTLYERDEKGELIPQEVTLQVTKKDMEENPELKGQTIKIIPLTRGELKKMFGFTGKPNEEVPDTTKDDDGELILNKCKSPQYTEEEVPYIKPAYTRSIVRTILVESGVKIDDESGEKRIDKSDEFGKNS